jgi:hypothetical protein
MLTVIAPLAQGQWGRISLVDYQLAASHRSAGDMPSGGGMVERWRESESPLQTVPRRAK